MPLHRTAGVQRGESGESDRGDFGVWAGGDVRAAYGVGPVPDSARELGTRDAQERGKASIVWMTTQPPATYP